MDAGAAEFEKACAGPAREQAGHIELALRIEAVMSVRDIAAKQAIGPNDLGFDLAGGRTGLRIGHDKMVANLVERTEIAPQPRYRWGGDRAAFVVKDTIAELLRAPQLFGARRQANFEWAGRLE